MTQPTPAARTANIRKQAKRATAERLELRQLLSSSVLQATPAVAGVNNATWTSAGPVTLTNSSNAVSGRITDVAADPTNANIYYVASAAGGVWKTVDAGATWTDTTDFAPSLVVGSIAIAPSNHNVIYAGTGESNQTPVLDPVLQAMQPPVNGPLDLGLYGEPNNSADSSYGQGVLRSLDGGVTWTLLGTQFGGQTIGKIAVDPLDPGTLYAAVSNLGTNGASPLDTDTATGGSGTPLPGIYRSTDGGVTWTNTTASFDKIDNYYDVKINPQNPQIILATTASPQNNGQGGIYHSIDGGNSWTFSTVILTQNQQQFLLGTDQYFTRVQVAIAPDDPTVVYASFASPVGNLGGDPTVDNFIGYVGVSTDSGATFSLINSDPSAIPPGPTTPIYSFQLGQYENAVAVDPANPTIVYLGGSGDGTGANVVLEATVDSTAATLTATDISAGGSSPQGGSHALFFDAGNRLLDGTDRGLWRLDSATATTTTWTDINAGLADQQVVDVALDNTNVNHIVAGLSNNGAAVTTDGATWAEHITGLGGHVVVDYSNPNIVYETSNTDQDGVDKSTDGGQTWAPANTGITLFDQTNMRQVRAYKYLPIAIDPTNHNHLVMGTDTLYETYDAGANWTALADVGEPLTALAVRAGTIYLAYSTLATNPQPDPGATVPATNKQIQSDRELFVTTDDGQTFTNLTLPVSNVPVIPDAFPNAVGSNLYSLAGQISQIVIDPNNAAAVYAVEDGFSLNASGGHVFESVNNGTSFNDISGNLPNVPFHTIAVLPTGQHGFFHTLYAGGDAGVYVSYNDGYAWQKFGAGLPDSQINSLTVDTAHNILAAGTAGRGVWEISTAFTGATIGNLVFNDVNGDGIYDGSEPGLPGITVTLFTVGPDGVAGTVDDAVVATTTTNTEGAYDFTGVASGTYYVHATAPAGYEVSPHTTPATVTVSPYATPNYFDQSITPVGSAANQSTGNTAPITVTGGAVQTTFDSSETIGLYQHSVTISAPFITRTTSSTTQLLFTVTLVPANATTVSIPFTTANGTGIAGVDYLAAAGTLTFLPGVTTQTVAVTILPSTTIQQNKTVLLNLTLPAGFATTSITSSAGLIINPNFPVPTVASSTVTSNPGAPFFTPVVVTLSAPAPFATSVQYTTVDGTAAQSVDYTAASGTIIFAAGQTTQTIFIQILQSSTPKLPKTFSIQLSFPLAITINPATATGTITIQSAVPPTFAVSSPLVDESTTGVTRVPFVVSLAVPQASTTTVNFTTANGTAVAGTDYTAVSGTLTFKPGQVSQIVYVPLIQGLGSAASTKTINLVLSSPSAGTTITTATGTATINFAATHYIAFGGKTRAVYLDNQNHRVTVSLKGGGSGFVVFLGAASNQSDAFEIRVDNPTPSSTLIVSVAGGAQTAVSALTVNGSISAISAKTLNVTGAVTVTGSADSISLGFLQGSNMTIGGQFGQSVALTFNRVLNSSITSTITIRSLVAGAYLNTTGSPVYITALAIGTIKVKGNFGATIRTSTVIGLSVGGSILNADIRATNRIGKVTAKSISGSTLYAGIDDALTALPAAEASFTNKSASIGSVSVGSSSDSNIASWKVGNVSIASVTSGSGVSGSHLVRVKAKSGLKKVNVASPTAGSTTFGDLTITTV